MSLATVTDEPRTQPLTAHQVRIIQRMADGHTAGAVGRAFGLSEKTIKSHLWDARRRVGARNTAHLIAIGLRDGWLI